MSCMGTVSTACSASPAGPWSLKRWRGPVIGHHLKAGSVSAPRSCVGALGLYIDLVESSIVSYFHFFLLFIVIIILRNDHFCVSSTAFYK